jgi:hypothetical protein
VRKLYYSTLDLAAIVTSTDLGCRAEMDLLERLWQYERTYILPEYRDNKRKFILDVSYWGNYLHDKQTIDAEFPAITKDLFAIGKQLNLVDFISETSDLDLFFKSLRIKILYLGTQNYARIKLRTLLKQYGYQRRSPKLMQYINECLYFYHIQPYVRGGIECDIGVISLDEMITFRIH